MIRCISKMDYTVYSEKEPGEYASWLTNDIHQMKKNALMLFFGVCESVCIILCSVVALGSMHPLILTACVGSTAILYFVPRFFQKSIEKSTMKISRMNEKFSQKITILCLEWQYLFLKMPEEILYMGMRNFPWN